MSDILLIVLAVAALLVVGLVILRARSGTKPAAAPKIERERELGTVAETAAAPVPAPDRAPDAAPPVEPEIAPPPPVAPEAAPTTAGAEAPTGSDDLTRIKGLGPTAADRLGTLGIVRYEQIAGWSEADIAGVAADLGKPDYAQRIARDRWVEQARLLARGETAEFEEQFGKLG